MNAKKLLESLKTQELNLDNLYNVLVEQKQAIVKNDISALEKAILIEQRILQIIENEERARIKEVEEIAKFYSLELKGNKLDDLLDKGKNYLGPELKELRKVRISLRNKLKNLLSINSVLKDVIDFSKNMIKETMFLLAGPNKRLFVNRKV